MHDFSAVVFSGSAARCVFCCCDQPGKFMVPTGIDRAEPEAVLTWSLTAFEIVFGPCGSDETVQPHFVLNVPWNVEIKKKLEKEIMVGFLFVPASQFLELARQCFATTWCLLTQC